MSDPAWRAVLASADGIRVWKMGADGTASAPEDLSKDALPTLPGPVVVAGLDIAPHPVPAKPLTGTTLAEGLPHVAAIPPLRQDNPAARSHGAETAIAGYLAQNPNFDGVLLVLGDETLWAHISAEEVVSFQGFLTAQIAAALGAPQPTSNDAFDTALSETLSRPDRLAQHLASDRAAGHGQAFAHLIGAEIASAKPYWLGQPVVILTDDARSAAYAHALAKQGAFVEEADLTQAYLDGFCLAWKQVLS
ncbi:2-dehydro-3-deoxygalactonokinase [Aestuariivita boseongensis]|uniref:2-dehydro-3-deoxygalactonokinase n=1 Tax=Aestuariivita boseongensis TaxID=1470562 RepID=UPI000682347A|nr:2-dehydro-3-deoxygalactonokinase [Aestuariivita boseongensis]